MKIRRVHTYKLYRQTKTKAINIATALTMVAASLGGIIPLLVNSGANALPNTTYASVPFSSLGLVADRTAPSGGDNIGDNSLQLNVDNTNANTSSHFYQTEGLASQHFAQVSNVAATLTVPSAWQGKPVDAGLWGVSSLSTNSNETGWPIIAFVSGATDASLPQGTGFTVYNTFTGVWSTPADFNATTGWDQTYNLEISYNHATGNFDFYVNDSLLTSYAATDGTDSYDGFNGVIFDDFNTATGHIADNYSVNWTNFKTGSELQAPSNFQMLDNTHNNYAPLATGVVSKDVDPTQADLTWQAVPGADHYIVTTYKDGAPAGQSWVGTPNSWVGSADNGFGTHGDGTYTFQVCAHTSPDNSDSGVCAISGAYIYDHTAPVVSVTPAAGSIIGSTVTFHITITDNNLDPSTLQHIWVYLYHNAPPQTSRGAIVDLSSGQADFTVDTTQLPEGPATFDVGQLADAAGNLSGTTDSYFKNYTIDHAAPTGLANLSPANHVYTTTAHQQQVTWTSASDPHGPITYYYESSTDSATNPDGTFVHPAYQSGPLNTTYIDTPNTPAGVYYWHVRAVDAAGNSTSWTDAWKLTVDNDAPTVAITAPSDGKVVRGTITLSGTVSDTNPDHYYFVVKDSNGNIVAHTTAIGSTDGTVYADSVADWSWNTKSVADGTYTVDLEAKDKAGNKDAGSVQTISVVVDNHGPVVTDLSLVKTPTNENGVTVNGTITDPHLASYTYQIVDSSKQNVLGEYSWSKTTNNTTGITSGPLFTADITGLKLDGTHIAALPDGDYFVRVWATDTAGNQTGIASHIYLPFTVDTSGPTITGSYTQHDNVITPTLTATDPSAPLTFSWVADPSNPAGVTVSNTTVLNPGFTVTTTGDYKFTLTANDNLGNATVYELTFTYTAPVVPVAPGRPSPNLGNNNPSNDNTPTDTFTNVNGQVVATDTTTPQVLGDTTAVKTSHGSDGQIKGDSTTAKKTNDDEKSNAFLGLGWWWILIVAALALFWVIVGRDRKED